MFIESNYAIQSVWAKHLLLTQTSVLKSEDNEAFHGVLLTLLPPAQLVIGTPVVLLAGLGSNHVAHFTEQ